MRPWTQASEVGACLRAKSDNTKKTKKTGTLTRARPCVYSPLFCPCPFVAALSEGTQTSSSALFDGSIEYNDDFRSIAVRLADGLGYVVSRVAVYRLLQPPAVFEVLQLGVRRHRVFPDRLFVLRRHLPLTLEVCFFFYYFVFCCGRVIYFFFIYLLLVCLVADCLIATASAPLLCLCGGWQSRAHCVRAALGRDHMPLHGGLRLAQCAVRGRRGGIHARQVRHPRCDRCAGADTGRQSTTARP